MEKLKRVVIKEEFVVLTGNFKSAILLNQMIYWSERVKDFDKFIEEEAERVIKDGKTLEIEPSNGWIYKTSEELSEETMIGLSASNMRKYLKELVGSGWLDERTNPVHKWDRTMQYRVNIVKIQNDLLKLGYTLEGYPFFKIENAISEIEKGDSKTENHTSEIKNQSAQNRKAIPEITTETTNKDNNTPYQEVYDYYLSLGLKKHRAYTDDMAKAIKSAMKNNKYSIEYCKILLDRHKKVVELTKKEKFPVKARALDEFFGQKVMNAKHLICSEYDEGGAKYETYLRDKEQPKEHKQVKVVVKERVS